MATKRTADAAFSAPPTSSYSASPSSSLPYQQQHQHYPQHQQPYHQHQQQPYQQQQNYGHHQYYPPPQQQHYPPQHQQQKHSYASYGGAATAPTYPSSSSSAVAAAASSSNISGSGSTTTAAPAKISLPVNTATADSPSSAPATPSTEPAALTTAKVPLVKRLQASAEISYPEGHPKAKLNNAKPALPVPPKPPVASSSSLSSSSYPSSPYPTGVPTNPHHAAAAAAAAAGGSGAGYAPDQEDDKKKKKKQKTIVRAAGGEFWDDPTLLEWDTNDFRLFAGDLGNEVTDEVLAKAFAKYPTLLKTRIVRDKRTLKSRGYGFVSFSDPNDFAKAFREMNGKYVGNRPIKLRKSTWKDRNIDAKTAKKMKKGH